jgi:cysteate synthase
MDTERYARRLGLKRLLIAFNGYWPERGACNLTGTFKDLEAAPSIAYLREQGLGGLVLASAGNTARAFAYAGSEAGFPCLIVVAERMAHRLWLPRTPADVVRAIVLKGSSSYNAAIRLSHEITRRLGIANEGGARNVARRDGLGTTMLEYVRVTGRLPAHYVQAVGSGAGGIAAYEASLRLVRDGRFGSDLPKLHLVQNSPITPIHDAWTAGAPAVPPIDGVESEGKQVSEMYADVLANFTPAYASVGGVRTALAATAGMTYAVTARDALEARMVFEQAENITIDKAAAVACAGLEQALGRGVIPPGDTVLLNITGGGEDLIRRDFDIQPVPRVYIEREDEINTLGVRVPLNATSPGPQPTAHAGVTH